MTRRDAPRGAHQAGHDAQLDPDVTTDLEELAARLSQLERRLDAVEPPPEPAWLRRLRREAVTSPSARYELSRVVVLGGVAP